MSTTISILQILVRICFLVLLVLGITFWTGHGYGLIPVHMITGLVLVVGLWLTSIFALANRAPAGLAIVGILWGIITIGFGMKQATLLPGSSHWIIQVLHLLVGMGAIGLNERLAQVTQARLQSGPSAARSAS